MRVRILRMRMLFRMLPVCVCVRVCGGVFMYVAGAL